MSETLEATGNKVDDMSYVHGVGMAQGLTQQGFTFLNLEVLANSFLALNAKEEEIIDIQQANAQLREVAGATANFQNMDEEQKTAVSKLFANIFYQTELFHPALDDVNVAKAVEGINDYAKEQKMPSQELIMEYTTIMKAFQEKIEAEKLEEAKKAGEEGYKWLEENAKREEVTVTESGLQYEILEQGEGECPTAESEVTVHYEGTRIDGFVFDSSYQRGEQISFGLNQVIRGWTEGLQLMNPGSKFKFYIPQELAYGERGAGADIPAYAALIFTVELFSFK